MEYGGTAHNRTVYAAPLKRLGLPFAMVSLRAPTSRAFIPTPHSTHQPVKKSWSLGAGA